MTNNTKVDTNRLICKLKAISLFFLLVTIVMAFFMPIENNLLSATSTNANLAEPGDSCSVQVRSVTDGVISALGGTTQINDEPICDTVSFVTVDYATEVTAKAVVSDDNFIFEGWYDAQIDGNLISSLLEYTFTVYDSPTVYYAYFTPEPYNLSVESHCDSIYSEADGNVQINSSGNADNFDIATVLEGEEVTVTAEDKSFCRFLGWYSSLGHVMSYEFEYTFTMGATTTELIAEYEDSSSTLYVRAIVGEDYFDNSGGMVKIDALEAGTSEELLTYEGQTHTVTATVNYGYTFVGWYNTNLRNEENFITDELIYEVTMSTFGVTYYAHYDVRNFKTVFDFNNTEENLEINKLYYQTIAELMPPDPQKDGFTFFEWNTLSNGEGTTFNENTLIVANQFIFAIYAPDTFVIEVESFIEEGVDFGIVKINSSSNADDYDYADSYSLEQITLTAEVNAGFVFLGWYLDPESNNPISTESIFNTTVGIVGMTYYAEFAISKQVFLEVINSDDDVEVAGSVTVKNEAGDILTGNLEPGSNVVITAKAVWGYNFVGWYTAPDGGELASSQSIFTFSMIDSDITYYAVFEKTSGLLFIIFLVANLILLIIVTLLFLKAKDKLRFKGNIIAIN